MEHTLDPGHFAGPLSLGLNIAEGVPSPTREAESAHLSSFLTAHEPEWTRMLVGADLAAEYALAVEAAGEGEDESGWPDMRSLWAGGSSLDGMEALRRALRATRECNPMAAYVYFRYAETANWSLTRTGVLMSADLAAASPAHVQVRAWDIMRSGSLLLLRMLSSGGVAVRPDPLLFESVNLMGI